MTNPLPSPLDLVLDPVSLAVIGLYVVLFLWESWWPRNRNLPVVKHATIRGVTSFVIYFFLSAYLPLLTDETLAQYQFFDLSGLSLGAQILVGILMYQLLLYLWHRALHQFTWLWRVAHQMHHSSERLDVASTYYFSPVDMIGFTLLGSLCFALCIGLEPKAISVIILLLNFLSIFQHSNIKTPVWLGYVIQRPEQHAVHHEKGVHAYNYSDLPIYDFLFGTFRNPVDFKGENGFYHGASSRVKDMLLLRDLNKA